MNKQKGFTLGELLIVLFFIAFFGTVIYVLAHFIHKFW